VDFQSLSGLNIETTLDCESVVSSVKLEFLHARLWKRTDYLLD
jgi:hypothetical protein